MPARALVLTYIALVVLAAASFLAENTGLASKERCAATSKLLESYKTLDAMLGDISR